MAQPGSGRPDWQVSQALDSVALYEHVGSFEPTSGQNLGTFNVTGYERLIFCGDVIGNGIEFDLEWSDTLALTTVWFEQEIALGTNQNGFVCVSLPILMPYVQITGVAHASNSGMVNPYVGATLREDFPQNLPFENPCYNSNAIAVPASGSKTWEPTSAVAGECTFTVIGGAAGLIVSATCYVPGGANPTVMAHTMAATEESWTFNLPFGLNDIVFTNPNASAYNVYIAITQNDV